MNTIKYTTTNNLCISCGLCKGLCPKECISMKQSQGMFIPEINDAECIDCGMCLKICPGKGFDYDSHPLEDLEKSFWMGDYKEILAAWTNNDKRREKAVSGGVVTELVEQLLKRDYTSAFLVNGHKYSMDQVMTEKITASDSLEDCVKSRYLMVSQENTIKYILSHRDEKLVLVGVSCFVEGIMNAIDTYKLNRDNYFIIGLFCDKTMTQNVIAYFQQKKYVGNGRMDKFYFRTKEVGGWPGGLRLVTEDGVNHDFKNTERMQVKEYFQPERCLYCLDKLNRYADVSVGDNYTGENSDKLGSNSVILRTDRAVALWKDLGEFFTSEPSNEQRIKKSQKLGLRQSNMAFAQIKGQQIGTPINTASQLDITVSSKDIKNYQKRMEKINVGRLYQDKPGLISRKLIPQKAKALVKRILKGA